MLSPPLLEKRANGPLLIQLVTLSKLLATSILLKPLYVENGYLTSQKLMITAASSSELDLNPQVLVVHGNK